MDPISSRSPIHADPPGPAPSAVDASTFPPRAGESPHERLTDAEARSASAVAALVDKHLPISSRFLELPPSGDPIGVFASPPLQQTPSLATGAMDDGARTVYRYADGREEVKTHGSRAWRNNNPGNLRSSPEEVGHTGSGGTRFAVFPNEAAGELALRALLSSELYATKTIDEAIGMYAPSFENDTEAYRAAIRRGVGVPGSTRIDQLTTLQFNGLLDTIRQVEGWQPGTIAWK